MAIITQPFPAGIGTCFPLIPGTKLPAISAWRVVTPGAYQPVGSYGVALAASALVIDADPRNYPPGRDSLVELLQAYPVLRETFAVKTPRGGYHLYLTKPEGIKLKKHQAAYPGIDWISEGGFVCGPGHRTSNGKDTVDGVYEPLNNYAIQPAPEALLLSLEPPATADTASLDDVTYMYAGQFQNLCEVETPAVKGSRGISAYKVACKGRDLGLPKEESYRIMRDYYNPRSEPPLSDYELLTQVDHAYTYARNGLGSATPEAKLKDFAPPPPEPGVSLTSHSPEDLADAHAKRAAASLNRIQPGAGKKPSTRDQLVSCATKVDGLFYSGSDKAAYATVTVGDRKEHLRIESREFKDWLVNEYLTKFSRVPDNKSIQEAVAACRAVATTSGPRIATPVRLAEHAGSYYLDLCDEQRRVVVFSADGWRLVENPPVRFFRPDGIGALPIPQSDSLKSLNRLRKLLNVDDISNWSLVLAFLTCGLRPGYPNPFILLTGEQGSGKSNMAKALRQLVDPHTTPLNGPPENEQDCFVAAVGSHMFGFDNVSILSRKTADTLCRISTGGGLQKRKLYTDTDTVHVHVSPRPMIMTSIVDPVSEHADLRNRALLLELKPLPDELRITEEDFWREFNEIKAGVLGALLDALCDGLKKLPIVSLDWSPRLLDFAKLSTACEEALGFQPGTLLSAYGSNNASARDSVLDSSSIGNFILNLTPNPYEGTVSQLLDHARAAHLHVRTNLPASPQAMRNELTRITPALRAEGVHIEEKRTSKERLLIIRRDFRQSIMTTVTS